MKVDITTNADAIARQLEGYPGALDEALNLGIRDVADEMFAASQKMVPVDKGTLKKSGNIRLGELSAVIGYNTPYAAAVHYGFPAMDVTVRAHDRLLRSGAMVDVRSHSRHIGPRQPRPYLTKAVEMILPHIPELIASQIRRAWDRIGGAT